MLLRPDLQIGPVPTFNSTIFMLLVLVCNGLSSSSFSSSFYLFKKLHIYSWTDRLLPNQAGVCLPSYAGLETTGFAWLPLAFTASLLAAWFAHPTIEPQSAPSARNRLQPDHRALRHPSIENVIRRHVHFMPIRY